VLIRYSVNWRFPAHGLNGSDFSSAQCHARSWLAILARQGDLMSFGLYAGGFAIVIVGLAYVAHLMRMPTQWILAGAVVMIGVGILSAVKATRQRDSSS